MTPTRTRSVRLPVLGALLGLGLFGVMRRRRRHRPTGAELVDDGAFAAFIESTGLETVATADVRPASAGND
jgi:hypothetical protein